MRIRFPFGFSVVMAAFLLATVSCGESGRQKGGNGASTSGIPENCKGKVSVLLLGMDGCPGTEAATPFITEYCRSKPEGTAVYRIDVPLPGKTSEKATKLSPELNYLLDSDRAIAKQLEFFFYPTLYILDGEGQIRYSGECEAEAVKRMVSELLAEKPGSEKKMYTRPMLKAGTKAPELSLKTADGAELPLAKLCADNGAFLYFSAASCPFSMKGLDDLEKVKKTFQGGKFAYAVIGYGEKADAVKEHYGRKSPDSTLIPDPDKSISDKFGVSAVPVFYVLAKDLTIVDRQPFTPEAALNAISRSLQPLGGLPAAPAQPPSTGAG